MKNTMNLTINGVNFSNVPINTAKAIEMMLAEYRTTTKAETPKSEPKTKTKTEPKQYAKIYAICEDGKSITIGSDGFIPTKVFKGVTYSLKQNGAKYDSKSKTWVFENKTKCKAWCKAQDARA